MARKRAFRKLSQGRSQRSSCLRHRGRIPRAVHRAVRFANLARPRKLATAYAASRGAGGAAVDGGIMPRLALSTVHLAVREYWTAAAALIGLCILGQSLSYNLLARPTVARRDLPRFSLRPRVWSRRFAYSVPPAGLVRQLQGAQRVICLLPVCPCALPTGQGQRDGMAHLAHLWLSKPPRSRGATHLMQLLTYSLGTHSQPT